MKKRVTSLLLTFCMLLSMTAQNIGYVWAAENPPASVSVTYEGSEITEIVVPQNEKKTVTAVCDPVRNNYVYQWQVLADVQSDLWVNVMGESGQSIDLSYALLSSVLDMSGSAYIRCAVRIDGETVYSKPVCATISYSPTIMDEQTTATQTKPRIKSSMLAANAEEISENEYVYVTINYLDAVTKSPLYSAYSSQLEYGTEFHQTILSPTFLGFAPSYNPDTMDTDDPETATVSASSIQLNLDAVTQNIVINVYYKSIPVTYAVQYFFQNINDDFYSERFDLYYTGKALTGTIISDEELKLNAGNPEGFTPLYHYPEAVAADGSTVFQCYYDRNYYLLKFDMNGGYGTEPIYARYGTPFVINDPTKHGYQFAGWDLRTDAYPDGDGTADVLPGTIPSENRSYIALWETVNANVTIVYWKENADDDEYTYWGIKTVQALSASKIDGATYSALPTELQRESDSAQFYYDHADSDVFVEGDGSTFVNVYYKRRTYTLTFDGAERCLLGTHTHTDACYELTCTKDEHTHDASCTITCGKEEHIHEDACCSLTEHTHTAECATANCPHKQHDLTCYGASAGNLPPVAKTTDPGYSVVNNASKDEAYVYRVRTGNGRNRQYHNYFYLNGVLYYLGVNQSTQTINLYGIQFRIRQNPNNNNSATESQSTVTLNCRHTHDENCACGLQEHTHGDGSCNYICGETEHIHTADCYACGKEAHTHTREECYTLNCTNIGHVHDNNCQSNGLIKIVTRKYGASLKDIWPIVSGDGTQTYTGGVRWDPDAVYSEVVIYIAKMPASDITLTYDNPSRPLKTMHYYLEVLPGETGTTYNGRVFSEYLTLEARVNFMTEAEDFFAIDGFTQWQSNPAFNRGQIDADSADFYYTRNSYSLEFINADGALLNQTDVPYGESIRDYVAPQTPPKYPDTYEPNAYTFAGWYTTPQHIPGTEYQGDEVMPAGNMVLYAKWVPVLHKVNTFKTYNDMLAYEKSVASGNPDTSLIIETYEVPHGSVVGGMEEPDSPVEGGLEYTFGGWFYMLNGAKTAFTPLDMPIIRDLNVFADWGSHTAQPYLIHYVLKKSPNTKVAEDTNGYGYQGTTRTFIPKAGDPYNQLFPEYNKGYFPTLASHSITMQYEEDKENPKDNTFTFEYVDASNIPYTVKYVNKITGEILKTESKSTDKAIVTERFAVFEGFVPDAFYKRLVISVEVDEDGNVISTAEDNVITFYYTPNTTTAFYAIHHMLQKPGSDGGNYAIDGSGDYTANSVHTEGTGNIGDTLSIIPQIFTGYDVVTDHAVLVNLGENNQNIGMNGDAFEFEISKNGTELYIFYKLKTYPYIVKYLDHDGDKEISPPKEGTAQYATTVKENAPEISGYTLISEPQKSITIKAFDGDSGKANPNEIVFYYISTKYNVQYKIAGEKGGTLSNGLETVVSKDGKYTFDGSTPTAQEGFQFDGWYSDEACTKPVDASWVDGNGKLTPRVDNLLPEPATNIFYAKFTELSGDFTITRNNAEDEGNGDQVFVYKVTNKDDSSLTIYVSITGAGSVTIHDLRYGTYTVEQMNDWSWRYSDEAKTEIGHNSDTTIVDFNKSAEKKQWLNGNSTVIKNVRGTNP